MALTCLSAAQLKCEEMKVKKRTLEEEFVTTKQEVEELLDELFNKSCLIERLKAKLHRESLLRFCLSWISIVSDINRRYRIWVSNNAL